MKSFSNWLLAHNIVPNGAQVDVAIVMRDSDGNSQPVLTCVMRAREYLSLARDWKRVLPLRSQGEFSGCYPMTVNGQRLNQGLIVSNIVSLTAVPIMPPTEGDA